MLYTRSSFLKWLKDHCDCEIKPIGDKPVIVIKNGPASSRMWMDGKDIIDYEEIYMHCQKLYLVDMPGDKNLIRIE